MLYWSITLSSMVGHGDTVLSIVLHADLFINAVDGGHRAIKYTRLGGVGSEIYSEGLHYPAATLL